MSLMTMLTEQLAEGKELEQLSRNLGTDPDSTRRAVSAALPMLLGALETNARKGDADSLKNALERDHDGSILDQLGGFLSSPGVGDGFGILRHALGGRQPVAERRLSEISGLSQDNASQLLALLAPIVMGALGRMMRERSMGSEDLTRTLAEERQEVERRVPQAGGLLAQLLDSDGDGDMMDDALDLGGKLLGSFLRGR